MVLDKPPKGTFSKNAGWPGAFPVGCIPILHTTASSNWFLR